MNFIKKILKLGWKNFSRNIGGASACIFILVVVVSLITCIYVFGAVSEFLIKQVQEKVDINVYFNENVLEGEVMEFSKEIAEISEIENIKYISKEEALMKFEERHEGDALLMESLGELGLNPFLAHLDISAFHSSQYASIVSQLEQGEFEDIIYKIDYYEKEPIIQRLLSISQQVNKGGIILALVLGLVAVLVAYNQVQLALQNSKQEIEIMRMVGASNWFIKGPFVIHGMIIGTFAVLITLLVFFSLLFAFNAKIQVSLGGFDMLGFFKGGLLNIFLLQMMIAVGIGVFGSLIAIRKYLRV